MRKIYFLTIAALVVASISQAQLPNPFRNFQMSDPGSAFTTNNFKCIAVGKRNNIWAGTQYGGLYHYNHELDIWVKSDKLTNVFINDIKMDGDSSIWIAQSGIQGTNGGASNLAGGINYLKDGFDLNSQFEFYSVEGTTTGANIQSRNVKSLYIDTTYKASNGRLPRVWAATSTYITSSKTKAGALTLGLNSGQPYFNNIYDSLIINVNSAPICEAIGGGSGEVWMATRQNGGQSRIIKYNMAGSARGWILDTLPELPANFIVQAIHVDRFGNRWLGLKSGGLVIKTPGNGGWKTLNNPVLFPAGTMVNFNAIGSDEYGNVFIGTTNGLIEFRGQMYNPGADPASSPDYTLYTTVNGLASNNITGITYDKYYSIVWLTSDAGVTAFNRYQEHIKGVVSDVFTGIDNSSDNPTPNAQYAGLQRLPVKGTTTAILLENGVEKERVVPDAAGIFELKEAQENKEYTVEVRYVNTEGKVMLQRFANIRKHTLMQPILMPDSLMREIKAFKPLLEQKCIEVELVSGSFKHKVCRPGFDVTYLDDMFQDFYKPGGIDKDHEKTVNNLANYYVSLATVYNLGGNATTMYGEAVGNILDVIESLKDFAGISTTISSIKKPSGSPADINLLDDDLREPATTGDVAGVVSDETIKTTISMIKVLVGGVEAAFKKVASGIEDPATKKVAEGCIGAVKDATDLVLEFLSGALEDGNGFKSFGLKFLLDNLKKELATQIAASYYTYYAQEKHADFVSKSVSAARSLKSDVSYLEAYEQLYNPASESLVKFGLDTLTNRSLVVTDYKDKSKWADLAATAADAGSGVALLAGGPAAAGIAKLIGYGAKAVKTGYLSAASAIAWIGANEIATLSDHILEKADLQNNLVMQGMEQNGQINNQSITSLLQKKDAYKQALANMLPAYTTPVNAANYGVKLKSLNLADSLYTNEMSKVLNEIWAAVPDAQAKIPGFTQNLQITVDSFIVQQYTLRRSLAYQNLAYAINTADLEIAPEISSLASQIAALNDSVLNRLTSLVASINSSSVSIPAYLEQERYTMTHSHKPGTAGSFTYTYKNYGTEPLSNVRFSVSNPTAGYSITSAKSISFASIAPGESKQISFNFQSPTSDSLGVYELSITADNYWHRTKIGSLYALDPAVVYSIRDGNWSSPATWSTNAVPTSTNGVLISHQVDVDVNAACKYIKTNNPAYIKVLAGKTLNVK